ncbi:sensor histidine kinase [Streptomyces physcomitrii]|uniref:histidine kinase n=1 Tax=Streptomyces physcomitrii TaxID=2724184 RepID=A0ABX1H822_9ACTN|nr:HAMP domain-containing sensor histidine kinase [Streptomyces physcomitrii]NKI43171.1 HAMP domain-containing histidine kinase [Streptomyces physcomitrii]
MRQIYSLVQCALIGLVLTALLVPLGWLYAKQTRQEAAAGLRDRTTSLAEPLSRTLAAGDPRALDRRLLDTAGREHPRVSVRRPDGSVRTAVVGAGGQARLATSSVWRCEATRSQWGDRLLPAVDTRLCATAVLTVGGEPVGELMLQQSADGLRSEILTAWGLFGLLLPAGITLCFLPAALQRRRTLRDLDRIGTTLHVLAEGGFHARSAEHLEGDTLKKLSAEVNRLAAVVQTSMEDRRSFLADVAHQLRNPMVALRLRLENLAPHLPEEAAPRHERLLADVDRLDRTLTQMLEHARATPADRSTQVVEVCGLVEECVRGWASVAERRGIRLKLKMPRRAWGMTRSGAVEQALNVLLDNALKYSPEGGVVEISIVSSGPRLRIQVRDEGPGLADSEREAALERGWRRGPFPSTGIGLSLAVKLIESAGGRLELCAAQSRGLSAQLHLVAAQPGGEDRGPGSDAPGAAPLSASGPGVA